MAHPTTRLLCGLIGASLLLGACTTHKTEAPPLTGPSELSTAIGIAASPDVLAQDGASQSLITITAHDSNGQLLRNLSLRAEIAVDGSITDFGSLSARNLVTDATGRAFVTYTAPPTPPIFVDAGTMVQIRVVPAGTNFDNATTRFASIRLVPPGVIGAPPSPFRPVIVVQGSTTAGDTTVFSANVTDSGGGDVTNQIASYSWSFGDGDTGSGRSVSHSFDDAGNFSVSLTITDALGRRATTSEAVNIGAATVGTAAIVVSPSSPNVGQSAIFSGSTSRPPAGHSISNFFWEFGDGTTGGGVSTTHAYAAAGNYTVILTVGFSNGAETTATTSVNVGTGNPTASFTFSPSSPQTNQPVSFNASASSAAAGRSIVSYAWSFDDGFNGSGVTTSHTYATARSYTVRLTVTDNAGQTGTTTQSLTVTSGNPTAAFTFSPSSPLVGSVVSFDASTSTPGTGRTIVSYRWNFDDGSPLVVTPTPTTTHTFSAAGSYSVLLTVVDDIGQTGQVTRTVSVGAGTPTASFVFSPSAPTTGAPMSFNASASTAAAGRTLTYAWNFDDGGTGTGVAPSHIYTVATSYTVRLTVTDNVGQTATTTQSFTVSNGNPTASFNFSPNPGTAGAPVAFTSTSSPVAGRTITGYAWNFGDPTSFPLNTATGATPSHTFAAAGNYIVTLTVTDNLGSTNTTSQTVTINP